MSKEGISWFGISGLLFPEQRDIEAPRDFANVRYQVRRRRVKATNPKLPITNALVGSGMVEKVICNRGPDEFSRELNRFAVAGLLSSPIRAQPKLLPGLSNQNCTSLTKPAELHV